jgi:electron-transferring-flavoprotein dehydrogenase
VVKPADYRPPTSPAEAIVEPTDPPGERIEVGVLVVGAGPAGLACAIRLGQLLEDSPALAERLGEVPVAVLDKGAKPGAHLLPSRCEASLRAGARPPTCRSSTAWSTSPSTS